MVAARKVPRVYRSSGKTDLLDYLLEAVTASGGKVLFSSGANRTPLFLGVVTPKRERVGLLIYPFRINRVPTKNRPQDEAKGQLRYGSEASWQDEDHVVARDIAGVDTTLLLGVYQERNLMVGLDAALYDPLPLGISAVYVKDRQAEEVARTGWAVWQHDNAGGRRRSAPRTQEGTETVVAFSPDRLLDYVRFEQQAYDLGLDHPLRYAAALQNGVGGARSGGRQTSLDIDFDLSADELMTIIATRARLQVAVRGGVAEHKLEQLLSRARAVTRLERLDLDGQADFVVDLAAGSQVRVECKNASPTRYANGDYKVEVQKTRASKGDPASRFYRLEQFEVVAACLYSATGHWEFRYQRVDRLVRHSEHPDRLAAMQRVDATWSSDLDKALTDC